MSRHPCIHPKKLGRPNFIFKTITQYFDICMEEYYYLDMFSCNKTADTVTGLFQVEFGL